MSEEPAFTFVSGGNMTVEENVHYNADNNTFTVTYTAKKLEQIDAETSLELDDGQTLTIVAVSFPVAEGESVTLWRRFIDTKLTKFKTVTTKQNGEFELRVKIRQAVAFKAKYKGNVSAPVQVTIKK